MKFVLVTSVTSKVKHNVKGEIYLLKLYDYRFDRTQNKLYRVSTLGSLFLFPEQRQAATVKRKGFEGDPQAHTNITDASRRHDKRVGSSSPA